MVSRSVSKCSEGSARTIFPNALPNFSCSALTLALTETLMTGSGKRMRSSTTSFAASRVHDRGALGQHAGVNADKGQRAVNVVDDFKSQRRKRLIVRGLALAD